MNYFNTVNPPKKVRVLDFHLPRVNYFTRRFEIEVPEPVTGLGLYTISLRNMNKFSPGQLSKWKKSFLAEFGNLVLVLHYHSPNKAVYRVQYASKLKNKENRRKAQIDTILGRKQSNRNLTD